MSSSEGKRVIDHAGEELHRVAVVVFANVAAVDYGDGCSIVERAVRDALIAAEPAGDRTRVLFRAERADAEFAVPLDIADVMSLDVALGNGYAGVLPTTKAFRHRGMRAGSLPSSVVAPRLVSDAEA